jgi:TolA-binding protein
MRKSLSDAEKQRLVDVVAQSTREGICQVSPGELDAGWQKLEQSLSDGKYRSVRIVRGYVTPWYMRGIVFVSMILGVGIIADWARTQRELAPASLAFVVEGASIGSAQGIEAHPDAPAELVFSDQSRVKLAPKTKVSVLSMDTHGAQVSLANGDLDVSVKRREEASWRFEAGPFIVSVKGTSFHLGYQAERGRLAVQMREGVVEVKGPSPDRTLTLRGGESLELFANTSTAKQAPADPAAGRKLPHEQPSAAREFAEPLAPATRAASQRARARASEPRPEGETAEPWSQLIGRGDFAAVVKDAEEQGLDVALTRASATDLTALADAARYIRRYDVAKQALLRVRDRFPGSNRSGDAAFFLGRLAEAGPSSQSALSWYEIYLRESPHGAYAGEALGREIALYSQSDRSRARVAARQYLERFPHGSQADLAKSLVQSADE